MGGAGHDAGGILAAWVTGSQGPRPAVLCCGGLRTQKNEREDEERNRCTINVATSLRPRPRDEKQVCGRIPYTSRNTMLGCMHAHLRAKASSLLLVDLNGRTALAETFCASGLFHGLALALCATFYRLPAAWAWMVVCT
eukprot:scaffold40124_cov65-Phaeocystis_antarctica.AAC.1